MVNITCLQDLLMHVKKLEIKYPEIKQNKYGSIVGVFHQFNALNLPIEERVHDEVMIVYFEENFDKFSSEDEDFVAKTVWLDKKTQMAIPEPEWFLERKKRMKELQEKIHEEYDPLARVKQEMKWKN